MRRGIVLAEVVNRLREAVAEKVRPHAIHDHLGHQWADEHQLC